MSRKDLWIVAILGALVAITAWGFVHRKPQLEPGEHYDMLGMVVYDNAQKAEDACGSPQVRFKTSGGDGWVCDPHYESQ